MSDQPPVHVSVNQPIEASMTITLKEVSDGLNQKLDKLDGKLDGLAHLPQEVTDLKSDVSDLKATVQTIDREYVSKASVRWWVSALAGLVVAAATVIALVHP